MLRRFFLSTIKPQTGPAPIPIAPPHAFSMRLINSTYTGDCIEVRRSSDNTTQNIGFSGGVLDETALLAFVGAGSGFIKTWYNQYSSNHLEQTTNANQPRIVNSGVVEKVLGKASAYFTGSSWIQTTTGEILLRDANNWNQIHLLRSSTNTATQGISYTVGGSGGFSHLTASNTQASQNAYSTSLLSSVFSNYVNGSLNTYNSASLRNHMQSVYSGIKIVSEQNVGFNGSTQNGFGYSFSTGLAFIGHIPEIIIYRSATQYGTTSDLLAIHEYINDYYAAY